MAAKFSITLAPPWDALYREKLMPELTPIQAQVLAGLLAGKSVSAAARENGIHRSTIYNWRHEQPDFSLVLDQARTRYQTAKSDLVQGLAEQALEAVADLLTCMDPNLRLRAAQVILHMAEPSHLLKTTSLAVESKHRPTTPNGLSEIVWPVQPRL